MGIILRQSLKTSIVSYVGMAIGAFNMIWLFPKFLGAEEIGLLRVIQDIAIVFVGLTHVGTLSVTDKLFPRFSDHGQKHFGLLPFSLLIYFGFFVSYCVLLFLFKNSIFVLYRAKSPQIVEYFSCTIPLTFFMLYQLALDAYTRVHFRIVVSGFLREVFLRAALAVLVIAYFWKFINFSQLLSGVVGVYGLIVSALIYYLYRENLLYLKPNFGLIDRKLIRELIYFYSYVIFVGFHRILISRIDILMIPALLGTRAVGIYSIALFIGAIIDMPCRAVNQISTPIIAQAWSSRDIGKIQEIYQKSSINQLIVGGLLFLGIWCNIESLFELMPRGDTYEAGKYVVLFIGLTRLMEMAAGVSDVILLHSQYYAFNTLLVIVLAILLFLTNLWLIPLFGITGAALAAAFSILLYTSLKFTFLWFNFRLQPFSGKSLWTVAAILSAWFVVDHVPQVHPLIFDIMLRSVLIVMIFVPTVLWTGVSEELNQFARKWRRELAAGIGWK
jgi:O-antigen/teichoic acid export membrane protein